MSQVNRAHESKGQGVMAALGGTVVRPICWSLNQSESLPPRFCRNKMVDRKPLTNAGE